MNQRMQAAANDCAWTVTFAPLLGTNRDEEWARCQRRKKGVDHDHRPDSLIGGFLKEHGEGVHHICFEVEDIEAALQEAKAQGLAAEGEKPRIGLHGVRIAFLKPESMRGVLIEICQKS